MEKKFTISAVLLLFPFWFFDLKLFPKKIQQK